VTAGPVGILGGTFNPVHNGHLRLAIELRERLGLEEVRLVPAARPPHRDAPDCPAEVRAELVSLAVAGEPGLCCDDRELYRAGPSYTIDTLGDIRQALGAATPLCLLVGADALAGLDSWHRWRELLDVAHLVAVARPGWELPTGGVVGEWIQRHRDDDLERLRREPAGMLLVEPLRPLAISSTEIRSLVAAGRSARYLVPDRVWEHIKSAGLYAGDGKQ
jgi:nicotinate-nucleotide adenylyltransferase